MNSHLHKNKLSTINVYKFAYGDTHEHKYIYIKTCNMYFDILNLWITAQRQEKS